MAPNLITCRLTKIQKECFALGTPSQTGTGTLIVNLMDVNDNFPEFAHDYHPVIYENQPSGLVVVHVSAVDRDTVSNGPPFEFWLPCGGGCPCHANPTCNDFAFKFVPGELFALARSFNLKKLCLMFPLIFKSLC